MREIKFRAWDGERMFNEIGITLTEVIVYKESNKMIEPEEDWRFGKDTVKLMQYTGLKDKNGKEIYEGDILIHEKLHNTKNRMIFVMEWDNDMASYSQYSPRQEFIVIGNIYENPELVK